MNSQPVIVKGLGLAALNRSAARNQLSLSDAWVMNNVRTFKGLLETSPGTSVFNSATLIGRILAIKGWEQDDGTQKITVYTTQKIYKVDVASAVVTDITRLSGAYTGSPTQLIDVVIGFDHALSTNNVDDPQKWDGTSANADAIGGTPGKAGAIAVGISYCILGDIAGDVRGIKWSDSGTFEVWTGGDAGSLTLYQGPGKVLKIAPLGEVMIVYRTNSIHLLFFVGSPFIWGQRQIVTDHGLIGKRAQTSFQGRHIYWGTDNIYIFDGTQRVPIADKVIDEMNASFDPSYKDNILAFVDPTDREVYFAYTAPTDGGVNKHVWVWNWTTGTWRQGEYEATAADALRRQASLTWDQSTDTWDAAVNPWNFTSFQDKTPIPVIGTDGGKLNFIDKATVNDLGVTKERIFETGLFAPFENMNKKATFLRLDFEQENKGTHNVEIWIGTQDTLTGDAGITWTQYAIIADGTKRTVFIRKSARYFAIRIRTAGLSESFRLSGFTPYFVRRGDR